MNKTEDSRLSLEKGILFEMWPGCSDVWDAFECFMRRDEVPTSKLLGSDSKPFPFNRFQVF